MFHDAVYEILLLLTVLIFVCQISCSAFEQVSFHPPKQFERCSFLLIESVKNEGMYQFNLDYIFLICILTEKEM